MNPNNPPTEEQESPQLTLEALVKVQSPSDNDPGAFHFELLNYPLKIDEAQLAATGEVFSLRKATTDTAMQMKSSGGIHAPAEDNAMMFFPWHTVQWIKVKLGARKIEREPPPKAKGLVTIGE